MFINCVCVFDFKGVVSPDTGSLQVGITDSHLEGPLPLWKVLLGEIEMDLELKCISLDTG